MFSLTRMDNIVNLAAAIYSIQKKRSEYADDLNVVSEEAINRAPWFVYNNVFFEGSFFVCVDNMGNPCQEHSALNTNCVILESILYQKRNGRPEAPLAGEESGIL